MTTNNAISELPPPFFYIVPKNSFFFSDYVKFACHSVQKAQIIVWIRAFLLTENYFLFLFFSLSPKKRTKKQFEGEATTWRDELEKLSVYEPA